MKRVIVIFDDYILQTNKFLLSCNFVHETWKAK